MINPESTYSSYASSTSLQRYMFLGDFGLLDTKANFFLVGLGYKQTWLKWVGVKSSKLRDLESLGYMFRVLERLRFKV